MALFRIEGEEVLEKVVGYGGESGRLYVPRKWIGQTVKIVRLSSNGKEKNEGVQEVQGGQGGELEQ